MTIPINILQSMISRNRNHIHNLEEEIFNSVGYQDYYRKHNYIDSYIKEEIFISKTKKEIKALVAIQKALKKEMKHVSETNYIFSKTNDVLDYLEDGKLVDALKIIYLLEDRFGCSNIEIQKIKLMYKKYSLKNKNDS